MPPRKSSGSKSAAKAAPKPTARAPASKTTTIASVRHSKPDAPSTDAHLGLLVEHLTFNPRAFIDALVYVANEALYKLGEELEPELLRLLQEAGMGSEQDAEREAEQATHAIVTLLEHALDHVFDLLELYSFDFVFGLTDSQAQHMVLPHQAGLDLRSPAGAQASNSESTELSERQRDLQRKLDAAKATSYALSLAVQASERRRTRTRAIYALLFGFIQGKAQAGDTQTVAEAAVRLGEAAAVIKAYRQPMLDGITQLRKTDPLGAALLHTTSQYSGSAEGGDAGKRNQSLQADQPWSAGREGYLRWQTERMLSSSMGTGSTSGSRGRKSIAANEASGQELAAGDISMGALGSKHRKRKSGVVDGDEGQQRKGPRQSVPLHLSEGGMEGDEVGKVAEMEQLTALLAHRAPAADATASSSAPHRRGGS